MISAWWLVLIIPFSATCGYFAAALFRTSRNADLGTESLIEEMKS